MMSRRSLLRAAPLLIAAPTIVRMASLMPVKAYLPPYWTNGSIRYLLNIATIRDTNVLLWEGPPAIITASSAWRLHG